MPGQLWVTSSQGQLLYSPLLTKEVLQAAQPELKFLQYCQEKEEWGKNSGETFVFDLYSDYDQTSTAGASDLTETATVPTGSITVYQGTATLKEKAKSIPFTRKYEDLAQVGSRKDITTALGNHYAKQIDADIESEFDRCKIRYVSSNTAAATITTNGTATATAGSQLNAYHWKRIVDYMYQTLKAKPYDGTDFVAICTTDAKRGIYDDVEAIMQYTKFPMTGEFGRYYDCRAIRTNTAAMSNAMGSGSAYGEAYFFGASGPVMYGMAVPMQVIPKEETDYRRSRGLAWYEVSGFKKKHEMNPDENVVKFCSV